MIAEHFARRWKEAGVIDEGAFERIVAWESANRRPVWLWAVAGMGALAIGLGLLAVVGANWETIPFWLKLGVDIGLNALCAAAVFVFWQRGLAGPREIAALLLFALVLSGIALIGQIYQLQSAPWRALVFWLALCTPFLALLTTTRLVATLWFAAAATTWFVASDLLVDLFVALGILRSGERSWWLSSVLFLKLLTWLPACLFIALGCARRLWLPARAQGDLLLQLAFAGLIVATSLSVAFSASEGHVAGTLALLAVATVATLLAAAALWFTTDGSLRRAALALLGLSFAAWIAGLLPSSGGTLAHDVLRSLLFILYWAAIGWMAARAGWRGLFGVAFTVIGLRLLVLYFEAIGGLSATGLSLIGGGVLCLGLAWLGWRLTRGVPKRPAGAMP